METNHQLTAEQLQSYERDGFLLLPDYFTAQQMQALETVAHADHALSAGARDHRDQEGRVSRLSLHFELPDSAYAAYARCQAVVEPVEQLLNSKVYHYHHKMMMKEPLVGGAWEWHQDFGYWYKSFLFPDMGSCMIAVDRAHKKNGCLQVLAGSHRMGRLTHGTVGDQTGIDPDRVAVVEDQFERVYCEMAPGTALFFHSNLLHRSDANQSPDSRWALICCYTAIDNTPFHKGGTGDFTNFDRWDADRVSQAVAEHGERLASEAGA
jgi:ectoine hydroxylase-related dioxygenase (phytanoyl-CoA dioxygenase family)